MRRRFLAALVIGIAAIACERDPASDVKIIARPTAPPPAPGAPVAPGANPAYVEAPPFRPELCNLQPEGTKGQTKFDAKGPCTFHHEGDVKCRAALDDFHTVLLRQGPAGATASIYLNVEFYKGPGKYEGGQMFLTVQNQDAYYHWGSDSVKTTVGPGLKYVDIPATRLEAEPPNTGTVVVSGRLWCADLSNEKKEPFRNNG